MTYLTESEENTLDSDSPIQINRGNTSFSISPDSIYCYGVINFSNDSDDLAIIDSFNWFDSYCGHPFWIPANYNYHTHTCVSDCNRPKWYDTVNIVDIVKYVHAVLGKPERIVIFKRMS